MLDPEARTLYTDALRPPPGHVFREAVAATYSLDLETLLTIPLHLALFSAEEGIEELLKDGVALLEALRRTVERITIYAQASRVIAPARPHVLYGLLEPAVVEVTPPGGTGAFHPKLWLLRFDHARTGAPRLRLLVLSRNVTGDRCWDLALTLEGEPGSEALAANQPLAELVSRMPALALRPPAEARIAGARTLAELAHRTAWELPGSYERLRFHAPGMHGGRGWLPERSDRLLVISPFVTPGALEALLDTTDDPVALVSRPEELAALAPALLERFGRVLVLPEQAELEDGEEPEAARDRDLPAYGLHAKAYALKRGWDTHLYVGSANATAPALLHGGNVELMAELVGRSSRVPSVDAFDGDGFGAILVDYVPPDAPEPPDPVIERARRELDLARRSLAGAGLRVRFAPAEDRWTITLQPPAPLALEGVGAVTAWLVTRREETAVAVDALRAGDAVALPDAPLPLLTSFVAFQLVASGAAETVRFVLALEADDLPVAERDAAIIRDVIRNREGFLRYVMLLLAEAGEGDDVFGAGAGGWGAFGGRTATAGEAPVFEHLTRAFCREPARLRAVSRLIREIGSGGGDEVIPTEFLDLWAVFEAALPAEEGAGP